MNNNVFLDSNVFIYAADKNSLYYREAVDFIRESLKTGLYTADVCIIEFFQIITDGRKTPKPFAPAEAILYIRKMLNTPDITILGTDKLNNLNNINQDEIIKYNITRYSIYDYLIATCLKQNEITKIATFNTKNFRKYSWLCVVDPRIAQKTEHKEQSTMRHVYPVESIGSSTGPPSAMPFIPYGRQSIDEKDVASVCSVLRSDWLTQGPKIKEFENAIAAYCGAKYTVAVSSGTAALHIACLAAGLGKDDTLWTSPNTFVASANCAIYCNAMPDFVDINSLTYNMDVNKLEAKLIEAAETDSLPKIVMPVHFAGQSCEMERIYDLSNKYNFKIIEDACHALGGSYKNKKIGSCVFSNMVVFSFHPVKTLTTGEGGMILTNNEELYEKLLLLRTHGITRDSKFMEGNPDGPWYYQQINLGMNYRLTDMQASLGISQLTHLDEFISRRHELAKRYNEALSDLPITTPYMHPETYSAFHLYVIRLKLNKIKKTRKEVYEFLRKKGIGLNVHYIPVHTQPYYRRLGFDFGDFPLAEKYYEGAVTLPLHPSMTMNEQDHVIDALKEFFKSN